MFKVQNEGLVTSKDEPKIFHKLLEDQNKHDPDGLKNIQARAIYDMSQGRYFSSLPYVHSETLKYTHFHIIKMGVFQCL